MADATKDRNTIKNATATYQPQVVLNMPAATIAYSGTMKVADANQRAINPADVAAINDVAGVVKQRVDNSAGAADAKKVELETGVFKFTNNGAVTIAMVGQNAVAVDNQTVAPAAQAVTNRWPIAGKITGVDTDGVWVDVGNIS